MKISDKLFIFIFFIFASAGFLDGYDRRFYNSAFLKRYSVSRELRTVLDQHIDEILEKINNHKKDHTYMTGAVWPFSWLPGYLVKYNPWRMKGRKKVRECIEKYHLDHLRVPAKLIYHVKGRPVRLGEGNYFLLAEKLERASKNIPFSLEEMRQLCILIRCTGYRDCHRDNFLRLENNQIAIIDTEDRDISNNGLTGFLRFISDFGRYDLNREFSREALKHLLTELSGSLTEVSEARYAKIYETIFNSLRANKLNMDKDIMSCFEVNFRKLNT